MFCSKLSLSEEELKALIELRKQDLNRYIDMLFDIMAVFNKYDKKTKTRLLELKKK